MKMANVKIKIAKLKRQNVDQGKVKTILFFFFNLCEIERNP